MDKCISSSEIKQLPNKIISSNVKIEVNIKKKIKIFHNKHKLKQLIIIKPVSQELLTGQLYTREEEVWK
jgi:hypothetical protein